MSGDVAYAFVAGSVATVNPCGFALLPAYLGRQLGAGDGRPSAPRAVADSLRVGGLTTAGFVLVFGAVGGAIVLGARSLTDAIPWAALAIGVALIAVGFAALIGKGFAAPVSRLAPRGANGSGARSAIVFGIAYGIASCSCTLPIFLGVLGAAVAGGGTTGLLMPLGYAAGMGTVLTALALAASFSHVGLFVAIRRLLPHMRRLSAIMLIAAGAYVVYYWSVAMFAPVGSSAGGPIEFGNKLSYGLRAWLSEGRGREIAAATFALVALLIIWVLTRALFGASQLRVPREPGRARSLVLEDRTQTDGRVADRPRQAAGKDY